MACIILNNGRGPTLTPDDARNLEGGDAEALLEQVLPFVDDDVRESVHGKLAPCTPGEFLAGLMEEVGEDAPDLMVP
jgi:hypothetical protein